MTHCRQVVDLMLDFIEGSLSPELDAELSKHFDDCPPCTRFLDTYKGTTALCRDGLMREAPVEFTERLKTFLREHAK